MNKDLSVYMIVIVVMYFVFKIVSVGIRLGGDKLLYSQNNT
jgi:hypothetical protein